MNKSDIAYKKIKEMLFKGMLGNGNPVSENTLVDDLKMSRTPIRAALQRLSYEGFLMIVPNQGIVICEPSLEETREKLELRVAVELYLLRKCMNSITPKDIEILHEIIDRQEETIRRSDLLGFFHSDVEFHTYILKNYKNETMSKIVLNFRERFFTLSLQGLAKRSAYRMENSLNEHKAIIAALERQDFVAAADLLENHIENSVLELLKSGGARSRVEEFPYP